MATKCAKPQGQQFMTLWSAENLATMNYSRGVLAKPTEFHYYAIQSLQIFKYSVHYQN
jgi:hypothetical protein